MLGLKSPLSGCKTKSLSHPPEQKVEAKPRRQIPDDTKASTPECPLLSPSADMVWAPQNVGAHGPTGSYPALLLSLKAGDLLPASNANTDLDRPMIWI